MMNPIWGKWFAASWNFETIVTHNAAAALAAAEVRTPDVIITNIIMPKTNAVDVIKEARAEHPRVRVIAISGGGSFGPLTYKPDAISKVLTKPFDLSELLAAIRRQLPN
jgi:two-component system, NtrC family, response regulator GlrR